MQQTHEWLPSTVSTARRNPCVILPVRRYIAMSGAVRDLQAFREAALRHAKQVIPEESCGLVVIRNGKDIYVAANNIALDRRNNFEIDPVSYVKAASIGEIAGVVHSHPFQRPDPSEADKAACEQSQLPWWIVNPSTEEWGYLEPAGVPVPLFGRPYSHGILDCFSFVRDYYREVYGIIISDYYREEEWWAKGQTLYLDYFQQEGFVEIPFSDTKEGDAFLLAIDSDTPNHGAIYVGNNQIAHHLYKRISSRDIYGKFYRDRTVKVVRHRSMI